MNVSSHLNHVRHIFHSGLCIHFVNASQSEAETIQAYPYDVFPNMVLLKSTQLYTLLWYQYCSPFLFSLFSTHSV